MTMEAVETDLTLNEEGLDAVAGFLKSVAEEKPVPGSLEKRQLSLFWEPPIDNEVQPGTPA
ncbi:MAG: hypothetical protein IKN32_07460 [Bacteroidales bacterium]|nr:hypothetical protein [Bacteroidales bacterium]